jgi:hypothetical protein
MIFFWESHENNISYLLKKWAPRRHGVEYHRSQPEYQIYHCFLLKIYQTKMQWQHGGITLVFIKGNIFRFYGMKFAFILVKKLTRR